MFPILYSAQCDNYYLSFSKQSKEDINEYISHTTLQAVLDRHGYVF